MVGVVVLFNGGGHRAVQDDPRPPGMGCAKLLDYLNISMYTHYSRSMEGSLVIYLGGKGLSTVHHPDVWPLADPIQTTTLLARLQYS